MIITTIACPIAMSHLDVDPLTAPIWTDLSGNQYRVASGILGEVLQTEHITASPDKITILVGLSGISALEAMGLKPPTHEL